MKLFWYRPSLPDNYFEGVNWDFVIIFWCIIIILFIYTLRRSRNSEPVSRLKTKFIHSKDFVYFDNILCTYFPYYQNLHFELKRKFVRRLEIFLEMKSFIPRQTEANESINILIAATATQITFGLENFSLFTFNKILIYPDAYYSDIRKQHHKGEINVQARLIVLSARHFLDGIKNYKDGINLGLHELAHALNVHEFENKNDEFMYYFKEWQNLALIEMPIILADDNHFIRNYAATNIQEMFAVSTEYFFEKPDIFQEKLPNMYKKMCQVYKQNPLNKEFPLLKF